MAGFFGGFAKGRTAAYVEIGNASVAGMIVSHGSGKKKREVLYYKRVEIPAPPDGKKPDFAKIFDDLMGVLRELLRDMREVKGARTARVYCSLASPWYSIAVHHARGAQEKEFTVEEKTIRMLLDSERKALSEHIEKNLTTKEEETEIMDARAIRVVLNGYDTDHPYGKTTRDIEVHILASLSSKHILEGVEKTVRTIFPHATLALNSFTLLSFLALRNMWPEKNNFLFVDITGEATDIVCVRDGGIISSVVFPVGRRMIGELAQGATEPPPLVSAASEWGKEFFAAVQTLSAVLPIPGFVFFVAHPSIAAIVSAEIIQVGKHEDLLVAGDGFDPTPLTDTLFTPLFSHMSRVSDPDVFVLMVALGFETIAQSEKHVAYVAQRMV